MAGFPLMAFGAGLGKWAENYRAEQEARARNQMLELTLSKYRREMEGEKAQDEAASVFSGLNLGNLFGGGAPTPSAPTDRSSGGGLPSSSSLWMRESETPAPAAAPRQPPPPGVGGAFRSAGDAWLAQNAPFPTLGRTEPQPDASRLPWTMNEVPASAYAEARGPGAPVGGPVTPPSAASMPPPRGAAPGVNFPQMAQGSAPAAQPQSQTSGLNIPPPAQLNPDEIARAIKQQNPNISPRAFRLVMDAVQKQLGTAYKQRFDTWAKTYDFNLRERGLAVQQGQLGETGRHNVATETLGRQQLGETGRSNLAAEADREVQRAQEALRIAETNRANLATEANRSAALSETVTSNRMTEADRAEQRKLQERGVDYEGRKTTLAEQAQGDLVSDRKEGRDIDRARVDLEKQRVKIAEDVAAGRRTKVEGQQKMAVSEARSLADKARYLHEAIEGNPNLVGTRGMFETFKGTFTEQAKLDAFKAQQAEFNSQINLLRAQVLKSLNINKYMTKGALAELHKLVPNDEVLTSPTQAKAALRNIAKALEDNADRAEAAMGGVEKDYDSMSTDQLFKMLGQDPPAQ